MLVLGSASFAQNKDAKKPAKKEAKPVKTETPVQQPTPSTAPPPKVGKGKTKKDGTQDMRYKANKETYGNTYSKPNYSTPSYSTPSYSTPKKEKNYDNGGQLKMQNVYFLIDKKQSSA